MIRVFRYSIWDLEILSIFWWDFFCCKIVICWLSFEYLSEHMFEMYCSLFTKKALSKWRKYFWRCKTKSKSLMILNETLMRFGLPFIKGERSSQKCQSELRTLLIISLLTRRSGFSRCQLNAEWMKWGLTCKIHIKISNQKAALKLE